MAGVVLARVAERHPHLFVGTRNSNTQSEYSVTISKIDTASSHHVLGYVQSVPYLLMLIIGCTWHSELQLQLASNQKPFRASTWAHFFVSFRRHPGIPSYYRLPIKYSIRSLVLLNTGSTAWKVTVFGAGVGAYPASTK